MGRSASGVLVSGLDPDLAELALAHGIATHFSDWRGGNVEVSTAAVTGVLTALGVDVSSANAVQRALVDVRDAPWRRMLPSYLVVRAGRAASLAVHVPHGDAVSLRVDLEDGGHRELDQLMEWVDPRQVDETLIGEATFAIADDLPLGYHTLHSVSGERHERAPLIVVPDRLVAPDGRAWGFMLQLYAVRSRSSWGMGDLHDLAKLATWSAHELGADFALVNPLHAVAPVPPIEPSPYYPASRRFVNPLYLRVEDVAEVRALPVATVDAAAAPLQRTNEVDADIDRDAIWTAKRGTLHRAFEAPRDPVRQAVLADFVAAQGEALTDFATWCALVERHGLPWSSWPQALRDPRSAAVADFRAVEHELVDFHAWLQWLCAEQLAGAQHAPAMPA